MRAAGWVYTNLLTIKPGRFYFSFVTKVPIFVKDKDDPEDNKTKNDHWEKKMKQKNKKEIKRNSSGEEVLNWKSKLQHFP